MQSLGPVQLLFVLTILVGNLLRTLALVATQDSRIPDEPFAANETDDTSSSSFSHECEIVFPKAPQFVRYPCTTNIPQTRVSLNGVQHRMTFGWLCKDGLVPAILKATQTHITDEVLDKLDSSLRKSMKNPPEDELAAEENPLLYDLDEIEKQDTLLQILPDIQPHHFFMDRESSYFDNHREDFEQSSNLVGFALSFTRMTKTMRHKVVGNMLDTLPKPIQILISNPHVARTVNSFVQSFALTTDDGITVTYATQNSFKNVCAALAELTSSRHPEQTLCQYINLITTGLICGAPSPIPLSVAYSPLFARAVSWLPPQCSDTNLAGATTTFAANEPFDALRLQDLRVAPSNPLPQQLTSDIIEKERVVHFYLFRSTQEATLVSERMQKSTTSAYVLDLIPGWEIRHIISVEQEEEHLGYKTQHDTFASAFISQLRGGKDPCRVLLTLRPTITMLEWETNVLYSMTDELVDPTDFPGVMTHKGFSYYSKALFPPIQVYLNDLMPRCHNSVDLLITGHSLGGGLGQVLSLVIYDYFRQRVKISNALYAPPNVFNAQGAELYGKVINARIIAVDLDPVPQMPCSTQLVSDGMPSCHNDTISRHFYVSSPGRYEIPFSSLSTNYGVAETCRITIDDMLFKKFHCHIPVTLQMGIVHICAYRCWASSPCRGEAQSGWNCDTCPFTITPFHGDME